MDKKTSEGKRKSRSTSEGPPDKKARVDIENILLPTENRNNDLSSHSINALESLNTSKAELIESSNNPTSSKENPTSLTENIVNGAETNNSKPNENTTDEISKKNSNINVDDNQNCLDESYELSLTVHQSTSIEEATGIRTPSVNTENKLIECSILVDTNEKKIKWDDKKNSTSTDVAGNSVKNSQDPQTSTDTPSVPRAKCIYGAECFRTNSDHKIKFSHPGDADFDVKDNRPECQYGVNCYRKSAQHKKDYKHTLVRRKRKVIVDRLQMLKRGPKDDSDKDSDESSFEESVDESEYGPSELDESSEEESEIDEDDWK